MDAPLRSQARSGVNTIRSSQARTLLVGTPVGLSARKLTAKSDGAPPPNREEEQKRTLLPN